jgi:hypothetical protein
MAIVVRKEKLLKELSLPSDMKMLHVPPITDITAFTIDELLGGTMIDPETPQTAFSRLGITRAHFQNLSAHQDNKHVALYGNSIYVPVRKTCTLFDKNDEAKDIAFMPKTIIYAPIDLADTLGGRYDFKSLKTYLISNHDLQAAAKQGKLTGYVTLFPDARS